MIFSPSPSDQASGYPSWLKRTGVCMAMVTTAVSVLFWLKPDLDLMCTALFYQKGLKSSFFWSKEIWVKLLHRHAFTWSTFFVSCMGIWGILQWKKKMSLRGPLYMMFFLIVGPGYLVHMAKNVIHRPRPFQVQHFGGPFPFRGVFQGPVKEDLVMKNASFPSGHAASGFMVIGLSFCAPGPLRYVFFGWGVFLGLLFGYGRLLQGQHFLSDVLFSWVMVFWSAWFLALWLKPWEDPEMTCLK